VRFKTVRAPDLIREVYLKTARDEEPLNYYLAGNFLERPGDTQRKPPD
jgi:hypothetical protein